MQNSSFDQKLTPMMEQYRSIKKTCAPDTILFFRLGDFYEMFFEDALRASEILNITLTGRDAGSAGRVPMCGIPYHAFHQYVRILLDRNLKVAICEQIGDPGTGQRAVAGLPPAPAVSKGLVERKIARIISPATFLDEEASSSRREYLTALVRGESSAAVASLDLSTGEFFVRDVSRDRLVHELTLLSPREVIIPSGLAAESALMAVLKEHLRASITIYEDWIFSYEEGMRLIKESFGLATERSLVLTQRPTAVCAVGAILYYLRDHRHSVSGHVRAPILVESREFMTLDRQTLQNLELVSSLSDGARIRTLLHCVDDTLTPMGRRALEHWMTRPLLSLQEIHRRQDTVAELLTDARRLDSLRAVLTGIRDVERNLSRLHYQVGTARDLLAVRFFLERVPEIQKIVGTLQGEMARQLLQSVQSFSELKELIVRSIVDNAPLAVKEGGLIRDGYSSELDQLRRLKTEGRSWLLQFQQRECERTGIKSLRIKYSQVFGYSIEVSTSHLHLVPPDYVRRQTLANAERFVVPELQEWDEQITGAEEKIRTLEFQLFEEIREKVLSHLSLLQETAQAVGVLDVLQSLAWVALRKQWVRPVVDDSHELRIEGGRHPVVEMMLEAGTFVENDTFLDGEESQLILLTGPNMAGKSTYIRQVAQIVLLAQIGSFVPAKSARIGLVDRIFTRIGAHDDLARGESTFMVEMVEMAQILQAATRQSLLILDEVGRGTSTFDGVSLAWAMCEHLVQEAVRPRTLFATHYHELIQLEFQLKGIKNYTMAVKETPAGIVFLRRVVQGGSDRSYGIHVAQLAGIPRTVTQRAAQILQVLEQKNGNYSGPSGTYCQ